MLDMNLAEGPDGEKMTMRQALEMQAQGKDPVQEKYIAEYKAATEVQIQANEALSLLAQTSAQSIAETMGKFEAFLNNDFPAIVAKAFADARADAQSKPSPEVKTSSSEKRKNKENVEKQQTELKARQQVLTQEAEKLEKERSQAEEQYRAGGRGSAQAGVREKNLRAERDKRIAEYKQNQENIYQNDQQLKEQPIVQSKTEAEAQQSTTKPVASTNQNQTKPRQLSPEAEARQKKWQLEQDRKLVATGQHTVVDRFFAKSAMYGDGDVFHKDYEKNKEEDETLKAKVANGEILSSDEQTKHDEYRRKEKEYYDKRRAEAQANVAANSGSSGPRNGLTAPQSAQTEASVASATSPQVYGSTTSVDRTTELRNKGKLRVGEDGLPIGRSPQEEKEFRDRVGLRNKNRALGAALPMYKKRVASGEMSEEEYKAKIAEYQDNEKKIAEQKKSDEQRNSTSTGPMVAGGVGGSAYTAATQSTPIPSTSITPERVNATAPVALSGPIPTPLPTQTMSQQTGSGPQATQQNNASTATMITLDPKALEAMTSFNKSFGDYVNQLASINIPKQVTISGNYTVDLKISGSAAIEALDKKIKEIGETFVSATDFTTALDGLRDEVSRAMPRAIKPSSSKGTPKQG